MTKTFTAPDGRALVVDGMDDIGLKWSSVVELDGSRGKTRLFTAPVGSNRMVEEALGIIGGKIVRSVSAGSVKLTSIEDPETKTHHVSSRVGGP